MFPLLAAESCGSDLLQSDDEGTRVIATANALLADYDHFNDGLILSFGFFYPQKGALCAQAILYARNNAVPGGKWDTVRIVIEDVVDLHVRWKGNQFNSICSGVHLMMLEGLWCLDIDDVFDYCKAPASIAEIQEMGDCYAIGRRVRIHVTSDCRLPLTDLTPIIVSPP